MSLVCSLSGQILSCARFSSHFAHFVCAPPLSLYSLVLFQNPTASKEEIDAGVAKEDVSAYAEVTSWEGRPPTIYDTIPVWLAMFPYRLAKWIYWHARFIILFTIMKKEYGPEEASYATSQALGMDYNKSVASFFVGGMGRAGSRHIGSLTLYFFIV